LYNILEIKLSKKYIPYPFILSQKAIQVYYMTYSSICKNLYWWCVTVKTKSLVHVQVDKIQGELPY